MIVFKICPKALCLTLHSNNLYSFKTSSEKSLKKERCIFYCKEVKLLKNQSQYLKNKKSFFSTAAYTIKVFQLLSNMYLPAAMPRSLPLFDRLSLSFLNSFIMLH